MPEAKHCPIFDGMGYATPPNWRRCRNLQSDGPTPCWYPHCDCMGNGFACACNAPAPAPFSEVTMIVIAVFVALVLVYPAIALLLSLGRP